MPADEYAPVVRGALKLKGSAPSGIKKKKKKPKTSESEASSSTKKSALQSALEEEDAESSKAVVKGKGNAKGEDGVEEELDEVALRELEERGGDGKTASERAYEEMRRKRVCFLRFCFFAVSLFSLEDEFWKYCGIHANAPF